MENNRLLKVFVSYAHENIIHAEKVRHFCDQLRANKSVDVVADCYEEDNPTGELLHMFMQGMRDCD